MFLQTISRMGKRHGTRCAMVGSVKTATQINPTMNPLLNPYPRPRLMFMDAEPCDMDLPVVIIAFRVVDGGGKLITGCNTQADAERVRDRFAARYPDKSFHVV